jgi:IPT/TIG domain-containing protein
MLNCGPGCPSNTAVACISCWLEYIKWKIPLCGNLQFLVLSFPACGEVGASDQVLISPGSPLGKPRSPCGLLAFWPKALGMCSIQFRGVGRPMRIPRLALLPAKFLAVLLLTFCVSNSNAQERPQAASQSGVAGQRKFPLAKQQAPSAETSDGSEKASSVKSTEPRDSADVIRKRAEWFYKQRSSVSGHIPAGARLKALEHMQRMMVAEGKLVLRPDGSYAEVAPQSWLSPLGAVTSPWTSIGPTPTTNGFFSPVTGRVMTIAVDPSDGTGNTVLLGGAMGGIWRSTDAGATWTAVGDKNASLAMGSIAFAPSSPSTVYAGTGEQSLAFDTYYGAGVLKSTDHGQTWAQTCTPGPSCPFVGPFLDGLNPGFGLLNFGGAHISYIAVNPTNPNMVLAGVQIIVEGPKEGVYCSDNGGSSWSNVLPDEMATFVGFGSSTVAYAAFGNLFGSSPGAPNGNGIYKATGIGSTCSSIHFSRLTATTLPPQSFMGRIDMGIATIDTTGNTVYASIADARAFSGPNLGVFVTTNGGSSWTQTAAPDVCSFQCWYDNVVKVDPNNKSIVFFGGSHVTDSSGNPSWVIRTENGGTTWSSVIPSLPPGSAGLPHVDNHAMAFVKLPTGKLRMYLGNDGGIWRTDDAEATSVTWTNLNNPTLTLTQFYPSISIHASTPSIAFGGTQDNGSQNYQGAANWMDNQLCGDGASTAVDSVIPSTVYIGCFTGFPVNASYQNGAIGTFSPAINGINLFDFSSVIPPLTTDPNAADVLYYGTTKVYQSADAGITWTPITGDLVFGPNGDWLNTIAVEPGNSSVVYVGANNGLIFSATNVTAGQSCCAGFIQLNQVGLPPRQVMSIAIDPSDTSGRTALAAFSGFAFVGTDPFGNSVNDPLGHIFKTADGGNTWKDVSCSTTNCSIPASTDLPNVPVNDLALDPDLPNILYAATDVGVFQGDCSAMPCAWSTVSTGLPRAAVISLRLHEPSRTLRAATHGRGAWDVNLNNFTFSGPHISSISPPSANVGSSSPVTLTVNGSGLTGGTVQWNGTSLTTTPSATQPDTQLTATIPASLLTVAGTEKITVVNVTQTSNSLTFAVLAGTPTLTSVTPSSTPVQTTPSTPVQIQFAGTNFSSNAKVLFNGLQAGITVAAPTASCPLPICLLANLPAALLGPFGSTNDISVLNFPPGGGQSKPLTFKVVALPPPNDNFANATNITTLSFNDVQDSSGATTETTDPTPPCALQFTSTQGNTGGHPNGAYNTIWYKFTPIFSANLNLDTSGSSYDSVLSIWTGSAGSLVNVACNDDINPGIVLQSQLIGVPLTAGTPYYIMVSSFGPPDPNPIALGGRSQLNFSYNGGLNPSPTVTALSPSSAKSGDPGFTLTVTGTQFLNGATVAFNGIQESTTFVSSTQLTATIQASDINLPGSYPVCVNNPPPGGFGFVCLQFTVNVGVYPVPVLNSLVSNSIVAGYPASFNFYAYGSNFAQTAVVNFNGVAQQTSFTSSTTLLATIPASAVTNPGTAQVTVSNPSPGGGQSNALPFTIAPPNPLPTVTSLNPVSGVTGTAPLVTITGTGFLGNASILFNGAFSGVQFDSSTQLRVTLLLYNLTPGTYSLYVVDPAPGGTSAPVNFTVTAPPPPPDFSVSSTGTTTQTVSAGQTATFTNAISVTAQNGFASQVNLSCSLPLTAKATACTVNPNMLASGSGTASVSVTTTVRGLVPPLLPIGRFYLQPQWVPVSLITLLLAILILRFAHTGRQRLAGALPFAVLVLFLLLQAMGCGGGSPPPPPPPTGTPAGTYTVTVTGTSGSTTHTTTLTLTVN